MSKLLQFIPKSFCREPQSSDEAISLFQNALATTLLAMVTYLTILVVFARG